MWEVTGDEDAQNLWREVIEHGLRDWERVFSGYRSAVDWPSVVYWPELVNAYPDAKILLTLRDTDSWWRSYSRTIMTRLHELQKIGQTDRVGWKSVVDQSFQGRYDDEAFVRSVFESNTSKVLQSVPPERLLVFRIGDGWEPLCAFLNVDVPDVPFPSGNTPDDFHNRISDMNLPR